jgi:gamma-glutamyl hercynylcysteine S-oxide synthase
VTTSPIKATATLTLEQRERKKRFLSATVFTCLALAMVLGIGHVVKLGANRLADMRARASYDLKEEDLHIRAAGEDIARHQVHQAVAITGVQTYGIEEVNGLLNADQWVDLNSQVQIPAGPFTMGTDQERADAQNKPQHTVSLPAYSIDKYLVSNAQYAQFVVKTRHRPPLDWKNSRIPDGKMLYPVTMVSWYEAKAYCEWAGKRLPTEEEWEKAARGTDARRWPWGDKMDVTRLNTYYNVGSTNPVKQYVNGVSPYGVFDMAGNVSQWTASNFKPYQGSTASADIFKPKVAVSGSAADSAMKVADFVSVDADYKVRRGGSWKSDPFSTSSFHRDFSLPHYASDFFGFRCASGG